MSGWPTPEEFGAMVRAQDARCLALGEDFARRGPTEGFAAAPKQIRCEPPTEAEFAANYRDRNPLLCGFYIFVIYRIARCVAARRGIPPRVAACYYHRDHGALLSRRESRGNALAVKRGELFYVPFDESGDPCDWPTPEAVVLAEAESARIAECIARA